VGELLIAPMLFGDGPLLGPESDAAIARMLGIPRSTFQRWRDEYDGPSALSDRAFLDAMALRAQERAHRKARRAYLVEQGRSASAAYWWDRRHPGQDVRRAAPPRRPRSATDPA